MSRQLQMHVTGTKKVRAELKKAARQHREAALAAIYQKGLQIIGQAVELAPVEFATLRRSHYTTLPDGRGNVDLGFGTIYANRQHEETSWHHPKGGQAKFLEIPLKKAQSGFASAVAAQTRRNVKSGTRIRAGAVPTSPNPGPEDAA